MANEKDISYGGSDDNWHEEVHARMEADIRQKNENKSDKEKIFEKMSLELVESLGEQCENYTLEDFENEFDKIKNLLESEVSQTKLVKIGIKLKFLNMIMVTSLVSPDFSDNSMKFLEKVENLNSLSTELITKIYLLTNNQYLKESFLEMGLVDYSFFKTLDSKKLENFVKDLIMLDSQFKMENTNPISTLVYLRKDLTKKFIKDLIIGIQKYGDGFTYHIINDPTFLYNLFLQENFGEQEKNILISVLSSSDIKQSLKSINFDNKDKKQEFIENFKDKLWSTKVEDFFEYQKFSTPFNMILGMLKPMR